MNALLGLHSYLAAYQRAHSEAEHLYTAATIAAAGAVAWGVAAVAGKPAAVWAAAAAIIGIWTLALTVCSQIQQEHKVYQASNVIRAIIAREIIRIIIDQNYFSEKDRERLNVMGKDTEGMGYQRSMAVVVAATIMASLFCVALLFIGHEPGPKSEVLCEGVRLIQEREARLAALDAAIARGVADADAGRVKPAAEVFDRLEAKYRARTDAKGR